MSDITIAPVKILVKPPSIFSRLFSVWYRHVRVYSNNLISNGLPPFLEPLIFLAGIGLGLGRYIEKMGDIPYLLFLASGLIVMPAMFTATFECTYGVFIRMEFDKTYDGMLSASITTKDLLIGEILFAATKSFFFSAAVIIVISCFGIFKEPLVLLAPIGGFLTGLMFAVIGLLVTSFVKTINHFNFYFTGIISPLMFLSGVVFPVEELPAKIRFVAEIVPLTHSTRIVRALCLNQLSTALLWDMAYIVIFITVIGFLGIKQLEKRLID